jgi:putative ABC transport system permease protein
MLMLWERNPIMGDFLAERMPACLANLLQWKALARSFDSMSAVEETSFNVTGSAKPESIHGLRAAADIGDLFGVRPALGRMYAAGEDHVAVMTHKLAVDRFGDASKALGQTIELNKSVYTIVGVWPTSFQLPAVWEGFSQLGAEIWVPLDMRPAQDAQTLNMRLYPS